MVLPIYEYLVIGAGVGGLASARRAVKFLKPAALPLISPAASTLNKSISTGDPATVKNRVAVIENVRVGGTAVNPGCVFKTLMFQTRKLADATKRLSWYGLQAAAEAEEESANTAADYKPPAATPSPAQEADSNEAFRFNWEQHRRMRERYIKMHHKEGKGMLAEENIDLLQAGQSGAQFTGEFCDVPLSEGGPVVKRPVVRLGETGKCVSGKHILIATGSESFYPDDVEGASEHGMTSDDFLSLKEQPKHVTIVGGGYIASELACVFHGLGSQVSQFILGDRVLCDFLDHDMSVAIHAEMKKSGIDIHENGILEKVIKNPDGRYTVISHIGTLNDTKEQISKSEKHSLETDLVLFAIGRKPHIASLKLESIGIEQNPPGFIAVDDMARTNVEGVYAIGDIVKKYPHLAAVAAMAGKKLAEKLFDPSFQGAFQDAASKKETIMPCGGSLVGSVVFTNPPIGVIGLSERLARQKFPDHVVKTYMKSFVGFSFRLLPKDHSQMHESLVKIVTITDPKDPDQREYVKGIHVMDDNVDEMAQGFTLAMSTAYKLTKGKGLLLQDLLDTIPIHPTSSEKVVSL